MYHQTKSKDGHKSCASSEPSRGLLYPGIQCNLREQKREKKTDPQVEEAKNNAKKPSSVYLVQPSFTDRALNRQSILLQVLGVRDVVFNRLADHLLRLGPILGGPLLIFRFGGGCLL